MKNHIAFALKSLIILLTTCWVGLNLQAQSTNYAPQGVPFQGVLRDNNNMPAKNREIVVVTTILDKNDAVVLKENFSKVFTNADGVFTVVIGTGTQLQGSLQGISSIDWRAGPYFIKVQVAMPTTIIMPPNWDYTNDLKDMGKTQFWSVPYALYAANAEYSTNATVTGKPLTSLNDGVIKVTNGSAAVLVAAQLGIDTTNLGKLMINSAIKDSIIKIINNTPAGRDSIISSLTRIIQEGKINGQPLTSLNDGVIKVTNGNAALLKAAQLGIDTANFGKLIINSSIKDSITKIVNNTIAAGNISGKDLSAYGLIVTGGTGSVLRNVGLKLDSSVVAKQLISSPIKDSLVSVVSKELGNSPIKESLAVVTTSILQSGKIAGQKLSGDNGIIVVGGDSAVLRATSLRLDNSAVAKQLSASPIKDSLVSVVSKELGNSPIKESLAVVTTSILQSGKIAGQKLSGDNYLTISTPGDSAVLRATSINLNTVNLNTYIGGSVLKDTAAVLRTIIGGKVNIIDTASMLIPYLRKLDLATQSIAGDVSGTLGATVVSKINGSALGNVSSATNGQVLTYDGTKWNPSTPTVGTLTSVSAGNLTPLFTTSVASPTTTPSLSFSLSSQSANQLFAGPAIGSNGAPSFRALTNADLPTSAVTAGSYNNVTVDGKGIVTSGSNTTYQLPLSLTTTGSGAASLIGGTGLNIPTYSLPTATASVLGGIKVGSGLSVDGTGLLSNAGVSSFSGGTTGLTPNSASTGAVSLGGTLNVGNGGTGLTSAVQGGLLYGNSSSAVGYTAAGTAGQLLQSNGSNAPTWVTAPSAGWGLTGNAGTIAGTNFVGTTDAKSLSLKTNNLLALTIDAAQKIGIGTATPATALEINSNKTDSSGLKFTKLTNASAGALSANAVNNKYLSVNATGDVVLAGVADTGAMLIPYLKKSDLATQSIAGDVSGTLGATVVSKINGSALGNVSSATNGQVLTYDGTKWNPATPTVGTLTSVSAGNLTPLFTTSVASPTTTPSLSFSLSSQSANQLFAGPAIGSNGAPSFRALTNADLPTSAVTAGSYNNVTVDGKGIVTSGSNTTYQLPLSLTTTGSGAASLIGGTGLNIPTYSLPTATASVLGGIKVGSGLSVDGTGLLSNAGVSSFSGGTTGLTPNSASTGAVSLGGTLNVGNGGTGLTSAVQGGLLYGSSSSAVGYTAAGTAGQLLQSNGSNAPTWVNAPASSWSLTGNAGTIAGTNFVGTTDNKDLVFKRNNLQAGLLNNDQLNTAFGVGSLSMVSSDPYNNGVGNVAVGYNALAATTSGKNNVAVGSEALLANTVGTANVALGSGSIGANTIGNNNTSVGVSSLGSNTTGSNNTAIGNLAGNTVTTGRNNIFIGVGTNPTSATANNELNIGNNIFGTNVNNGGNANIGINTATPANTLEINSNRIDTSGLRLTKLTNVSAGALSANAVNNKYLSVNATGDVVLAKISDEVIGVAGAATFTSPIITGSTPSLSTFQGYTFENGHSKTDSSVIYVNSFDGTQWTYTLRYGSAGAYQSYTAPASTEWYSAGSTNDAGSNKTGAIYRTGNVGIGAGTPNSSAALDINSTTQGILIPRMTTAERNAIGTPAAGLMVYDNTLKAFYYYDGTTWISTASQLEKITEAGNTGYRILGKNPANYGDIGEGAVDLSTSTATSTTNGALAQYSSAIGINTTASGNNSIAMGNATTASGTTSTAMGHRNNATGFISTATGFFTTAAGDYSLAMGDNTNALGHSTVAMGSYTVAKGRDEVAIGSSNDTLMMATTTGNLGTVADSSRLFTVGNGTRTAPSTAFIVQQNGNVGINTRRANNALEINSKNTDVAGLRFTKLTNASAGASTSSAVNNKYLSVNADGDVVLAEGGSASSTINPIAVGYTPATTGNPSANYNQYIKSPSGDVYYIDGTGKGLFLRDAITATLAPVLDNTIFNPATIISTAVSGDAYIIPATGAAAPWDTHTNQIATWDGSNWQYYTPVTGNQTTVMAGINAGNIYQFDGTIWTQTQPKASTSLTDYTNATGGVTLQRINAAAPSIPNNTPYIFDAAPIDRKYSNNVIPTLVSTSATSGDSYVTVQPGYYNIEWGLLPGASQLTLNGVALNPAVLNNSPNNYGTRSTLLKIIQANTKLRIINTSGSAISTNYQNSGYFKVIKTATLANANITSFTSIAATAPALVTASTQNFTLPINIVNAGNDGIATPTITVSASTPAGSTVSFSNISAIYAVAGSSTGTITATATVNDDPTFTTARTVSYNVCFGTVCQTVTGNIIPDQILTKLVGTTDKDNYKNAPVGSMVAVSEASYAELSNLSPTTSYFGSILTAIQTSTAVTGGPGLWDSETIRITSLPTSYGNITSIEGYPFAFAMRFRQGSASGNLFSGTVLSAAAQNTNGGNIIPMYTTNLAVPIPSNAILYLVIKGGNVTIPAQHYLQFYRGGASGSNNTSIGNNVAGNSTGQIIYTSAIGSTDLSSGPISAAPLIQVLLSPTKLWSDK